MTPPAKADLTRDLAERALGRLVQRGAVEQADVTPRLAARIAALADTLDLAPAADRVALVVDTLAQMTRSGLSLEAALVEVERLVEVSR